MLRKKTLIGHVALTNRTGVVRFGGAAANGASINQAASSGNTSLKKKKGTPMIHKTERNKKKRRCVTCGAYAANNSVMESMTAITTQTLRRQRSILRSMLNE